MGLDFWFSRDPPRDSLDCVALGHLSDHHFELVVLMVISYNWAGELLVDDPLLPTLSRSGSPLPVSSWLRGLPWIFLKVAGNVILNWPVRMSSTKLSNWSTLSLTWDLETVAPSHMPSQRWNLPLTAHMNLATNRSSNRMWSLNVFLLHPIVMRSCLRLVEQTLSSPKKISHLAANRLKLSSHAVEVSWYVNSLFQWIFYFCWVISSDLESEPVDRSGNCFDGSPRVALASGTRLLWRCLECWN